MLNLRKMKQISKKLQQKLFSNSIIFLKDGIERLVNNDNGEEDFIEPDLLILTCTSFQISIELAIKALIVEKSGIRSLIHNKQKGLPDNEIEKLFFENRIKTKEFDTLKTFVKSKNFIEELTKEEFRTIDEFQNYRNKIVHFTYFFPEGEFYDKKEDLLYYMIHILFKILLSTNSQDMKPSEFIEYTIGSDLHKKLIKYTPYINSMKRLAKQNSDKVFECIVCNNRTYSQEEEYCYCCNFIGEHFTPIDCDYCKEKGSVIYDNLNIEINNNEMRGLCLNCGNDGIIFQCPKCGFAYNIETKIGDYCTNEKCMNE